MKWILGRLSSSCIATENYSQALLIINHQSSEVNKKKVKTMKRERLLGLVSHHHQLLIY